MVLTVCIGASGSGKTTFLEQVYKANKCIYIRQYHRIRPFIQVNQIPNFYPSQLPFWETYLKEQPNVKVGGTMAGEFTAGLSGGQRKMLLFELIYQRTKDHSGLLICLDEPFAGVTDDFLPYLSKRVEEIRTKHNLLLVTNDHVSTLTSQADNVLTVSAINRNIVKINDKENDREVAIHALSSGSQYKKVGSSDDIKFFFETEVFSSASGLGGVAGFTVFAMSLFIVSYWNSEPGSEALILVALQIIGYFCLNPYLLSLTDWRNHMIEESQALLHSSIRINKALKAIVTLVLLFVICTISFGVLNLIIGTLGAPKYYGAMFFDSASLTFPFLCTGLYTNLPFEAVQIISSLPFLFMIFFSTTFSPGAGVEGVKALRYLFARFYFWCMLPNVQDYMEGCPNDNLMLYTALSGCLGLFLFFVGYMAYSLKASMDAKKDSGERQKLEESESFKTTQSQLTPPASPKTTLN